MVAWSKGFCDVGLEAQGIDSSRARCRQSIASVRLCARNFRVHPKKLLGREWRWQRHLARRAHDPASGVWEGRFIITPAHRVKYQPG